MKKNTAILDCVKKLITFNFNNEIFTVDIKEGDIHDSWNSIVDKNEVVWDVNFSWEDSKYDPKPAFSVYALTKDEDSGLYSTNWSDYTVIKIGKTTLADKDVFFMEERFNYPFDQTSPITCTVYNDKDEPVFKTKSGNRASDECYMRRMKGEKVYTIIMDKHNAIMRLEYPYDKPYNPNQKYRF